MGLIKSHPDGISVGFTSFFGQAVLGTDKQQWLSTKIHSVLVYR